MRSLPATAVTRTHSVLTHAKHGAEKSDPSPTVKLVALAVTVDASGVEVSVAASRPARLVRRGEPPGVDGASWSSKDSADTSSSPSSGFARSESVPRGIDSHPLA